MLGTLIQREEMRRCVEANAIDIWNIIYSEEMLNNNKKQRERINKEIIRIGILLKKSSKFRISLRNGQNGIESISRILWDQKSQFTLAILI